MIEFFTALAQIVAELVKASSEEDRKRARVSLIKLWRGQEHEQRSCCF